MKKFTKLSILTLATVLFTGTLMSAAPISTFAEDDFIKDFHHIDFLKVEVGNNFTIALTTTNEVYAFGHNNVGQLGIGDNSVTQSTTPINITTRFALNSGEKIKDIDAGLTHVIAVSTSNRIFTWGLNSHGQLGNGNTTNQNSPEVRTNLNPSSLTVSKVVASALNTLVLFTNNTMLIAGSNHTGMLLNGNTNASTAVSGPNISTFLSTATVVDIGASYTTGYILLSDGKIGLWGSNGNGQLGNNSTTNSSSLISITSATLGLTGSERVISVATGNNHTVALTNAQKVFFWGLNFNFAVGNAVAENDQQLTPFNITSWFTTPQPGNSSVFFGFDDPTDEFGTRPVNIYAGNDSTVLKLIEVSREYINPTTMGPVVEHPEESWYEALGLNNNNGSGYILADDSDLVLIDEPYYIGYEVWDRDNGGAASISFSETNVVIVNGENDFTIHGSNVYGQTGLGYTSVDEDDISNYSSNFRGFEEGVYPYLPSNLNAPIDPYFDDLTLPQRADEYYALDDLFHYYFDYFNEKEFSLFTPTQLTKIHTIFAEIFEDQVLYGWVPATNAELLTYVQDNLEERYWLREDMEAMANYESWIFAEWANLDDVVAIEQPVIDLLDPEVETRLVEFRAILAKIQTFENDVLQPFVEELNTLDSVEVDYLYLDEDGEFWLDFGGFEIEQLITLGYTDDILAIFEAYDELSELEQLLLMERHDSNYYELYYEYYEYFADQYADLLSDFESDVQDGEWDSYYPLFENISELETLLAGIDDLNEISYDLFVEMYGQENELFSYDMYEYWIWLNDLLPLLQEGKDVFDQIVNIEDLIQNDDGFDYVNLEDVAAILDMYADFLLLSEEAQDLLNPEYVYFIYSLALEALANEVEDLGWDIYDIEEELDTYGLFANYDDVLAALAKFEALPEDALEYLSDDAIDYYEYLLGIKLSLAEGLDVFNQIMDIEDMDLDNLDVTTIEAILDMYQDYLALSEGAQDLLDPEYVQSLLSLIVEQVEGDIEELPGTVEDFDALFNDAETKEATINGLLGAWNKYQAMSDDLKEDMDPEARAHLEALYARYLELNKTSVDLWMVGLIIVHLSAGVYFAFKKRDILVKPVQ